MADRYVFSDEAGNFDFSRKSGASRYFILGTVTADDCNVGDRLLQLRRELGWRGLHLDKVFHATDDPQAVRNEVFGALAASDLRIDATILEKSKAQPHLLGTKKKRGGFHSAVDEVVSQVSRCASHRVAFWPTESDPCLQVADYCTWAIQRKWERDDSRSYDLIKNKIASEFDAWSVGSTHFY